MANFNVLLLKNLEKNQNQKQNISPQRNGKIALTTVGHLTQANKGNEGRVKWVK